MRYFKVAWNSSDPEVPRIMLYEVTEDDRVTRRIEIFADHRAERDSVAWRSRQELGSLDSLVEGPVLSVLPKPGDPVFDCLEVTRADFEAEWERP